MNETSAVPSNNPWFGISMALFGLIVGYALGTTSPFTSGSVAQNPPPAIPSVPSAPLPPSVPPAPKGMTVQTVPSVTEEDHVRGKKNAKITLIEYSDLECPFCARHHPTMKSVLDKYGSDVRWVYRHYPLPFHSSATKGAEGAECAAEIGGEDAFWKFIDIVFEKSAKNDKYVSYATEMGLDSAAFEQCLTSGKFAALVSKQQSDGGNAGVQGTPGTFVILSDSKKGEFISGAVPLSSFEASITALLAE